MYKGQAEHERGTPAAVGGRLGSGHSAAHGAGSDSYTHLRAHETKATLVCRLLLEKKTVLILVCRLLLEKNTSTQSPHPPPMHILFLPLLLITPS